MVELTARSPWEGLLHPIGPTEAGVTVRPIHDLGMATLFARSPGAFAHAIKAAFGIRLPEKPGFIAGEAVGFVATGPNKWLAIGQGSTSGWTNALRRTLGQSADIIDQSSGYAVLEVSGPKTCDTFAKGLMIDLHPTRFGPGSAATTAIAHIGVTLWQLDDTPTYRIAVFPSYAGSFAHWLLSSAAEFGLAVLP